MKPPVPATSSSINATGAPLMTSDGEVQSAPNTLQHWRPSSSLPEVGPDAPRASSANSPSRPPRGEPSATTRLRERMRQREGPTVPIRDKSPVPNCGGWQERIELRQREAVEQQEIETQQRLQTEERSSRRNDVLRKVME